MVLIIIYHDRTCKNAHEKLSLQTWLVLIHWWRREYPVTDAAEESKVTQATAIQVPSTHLQLEAPQSSDGGWTRCGCTYHSLHIS